jgi:hypothetical protein
MLRPELARWAKAFRWSLTQTRCVLKLAHRHRNAAYHRDGHNPGVLHLICFLQLDAVCQLLPAVTSSGASGSFERRPRADLRSTPPGPHGSRTQS